MNRRIVFGCVVAVFCLCVSCRADCWGGLEGKIASVTDGKRAVVGVAVRTAGGEVFCFNGDRHFPLLSVFKFHVALAVLDRMNREGTALDSLVEVTREQLPENTYSPLRERYPDGVRISLGELLRYSVALSDNPACDRLIDYAGGIGAVDDYVRGLGVTDFSLSATEMSMHERRENQGLNRSTPGAVTELLEIFCRDSLFAPSYRDFLRQTLIGTTTGPDKLKGLLPPDVVVGHKTGSSDRTEEGMKIADNDAGFVCLPDGSCYSIAVLVADSYETDETNAAIIAAISKAVYEAVLNGRE